MLRRGSRFAQGAEKATRRLPELAPDFPSAVISLYEKESREADAKLTELGKQKKTGEKVVYSSRRHGE